MEKKNQIKITADNIWVVFEKYPEVDSVKFGRNGKIFCKIHGVKEEIELDQMVFSSSPNIQKIDFTGVINGLRPQLKKFHNFGYGEKKETSTVKKMHYHMHGKPESKKVSVYTGAPEYKPIDGIELILFEIEDMVPSKVTMNLQHYFLYKISNGDGSYTEVYCSIHNPKMIVMYRNSNDKEFTYCR